jgi:hypothetical protein
MICDIHHTSYTHLILIVFTLANPWHMAMYTCMHTHSNHRISWAFTPSQILQSISLHLHANTTFNILYEKRLCTLSFLFSLFFFPFFFFYKEKNKQIKKQIIEIKRKEKQLCTLLFLLLFHYVSLSLSFFFRRKQSV